MARVYENYIGTNLLGPINVSKAYPLDVKTVVESVADLTAGKLLNSSYFVNVVTVGLVNAKLIWIALSGLKLAKITLSFS